MGDSRIKDISALLSAFFDEEKLRRGGKYAEFFGSWKAIAGERLSAHSRIADIDRGMLIVEAEHPGWIQLLQIRQTEILDSVRQRFPELELRGILFRLGRELREESRRPEAPTQDREAPSPPPEPRVEAPVAYPQNPELRKLLDGLKETIEGKGNNSDHE